MEVKTCLQMKNQTFVRESINPVFSQCLCGLTGVLWPSALDRIYPGQIPVLGLLAHKDGLSQREIAEKLHIKPPTVNVTVQRLEKAGFLYREADEKDQRISRIYMTEKGKQAKESGMKKVQDNEKILLDGFSEEDLCLLRRFLDQIAENIEKIPVASGKNNTRKERQQK